MVVPLHVITEMEAQTVNYRLMCNNQWKPNPLTVVKIKSFGTWNMNPRFVETHKDTEICIS